MGVERPSTGGSGCGLNRWLHRISYYGRPNAAAESGSQPPRFRHQHLSWRCGDERVGQAVLAVRMGRLLSAGSVSSRSVMDGEARDADIDGLGTGRALRWPADI